MRNRYFEILEGFRWFKTVGTSLSNTWIGASRAIDTVYEPSVTEPGDTLHVLVGGTFLVRADGSVESGTLRLPKPILEKTYGGYVSDDRLCEMMAQACRVREVPEPGRNYGYAAAREAAFAKRFPERFGKISKTETTRRSPLLQEIVSACISADLGEAVASSGSSWSMADVGMGSEPDSIECEVTVKLPDGNRISITASPARREIWVVDRTGELSPALQAGGSLKYDLEPEYRNSVVTIVHESQLVDIASAVAEFVREGRKLDLPQAGPTV